ncbi:glutaredoxin domain-containing protein [Bacillus kexueae]|uniref:glutaredoxin domain-containing protein n=1 Tax=Aeribacillus kexueae TaxID=2078952 RepID=UPI001FAEFFE6|nr:glutaredoxin domain-containing protein [Bacillus kexueae]
MKQNVEVYTQPDCPPCKVVKQYLDHHNISYEEFDVSTDMDARNRMINEFEAYSTPTIRVGEELVIGFDLKKLASLLSIED